jgi:nicotinamidase-related amidase
MALTTLDRNTTLLVVDLQNGHTGAPLIHPIGEVVDRARALIDAFRARRLPVVLRSTSQAARRAVPSSRDATRSRSPRASPTSSRNSASSSRTTSS